MMEFIINSRSPKLKAFVEHLMPGLIKQLNLSNSRKFLLIEIGKNAPGTGNEGLTTPLIGLDSFVIALQPDRLDRLGATLAHEMVHVKQLAKGQLKSVGRIQYWKGKKFSKKTKYLDSPWEVEAFSKQEILFRRALTIDSK